MAIVTQYMKKKELINLYYTAERYWCLCAQRVNAADTSILPDRLGMHVRNPINNSDQPPLLVLEVKAPIAGRRCKEKLWLLLSIQSHDCQKFSLV